MSRPAHPGARRCRGAVRLATSAAAAALLTGAPALAQQPATGTARVPVYAPNGVVASSQPLASAAGLEVLLAGGNAIDAAVATAAALNVVEPFMTGLGGDLFAIVWVADEGRLVGLNASGRAGSLMTREELLRRGHERVPGAGAESVTVPGTLSGWVALLDRYGTLDLRRALEPAVRLARGGFPVSPVVAAEWAAFAELLPDDVARRTFLVDGRAPAVGEWFRNPDLALTLEAIGREGPGLLYGGDLGRRLVERVQADGGFLTLPDLAGHRADWVEPIGVPFRGATLWELPPNGQGIAALEMLRILEPFDLGAMGHNSADYLHHLLEAKKLAYADLGRFIADPARMGVAVERLLDDAFIAARRARIDPGRAAEQPEPGIVLDSETTYLTVADRHGNMVSLINSIASPFGSGVVAPGTGFALQNRAVGFSLEVDHPNAVAPGKRPLHTIIPAFVTRTAADGAPEPWISFGIVGGAQQPQAHVQFLLNVLLFGMDVQRALDAPRFRHLDGRRVAFESGVDPHVVARLRTLGHEPVDAARLFFGGLQVFFGGGQAIQRLERGWVAGSDGRRDGYPAPH